LSELISGAERDFSLIMNDYCVVPLGNHHHNHNNNNHNHTHHDQLLNYGVGGYSTEAIRVKREETQNSSSTDGLLLNDNNLGTGSWLSQEEDESCSGSLMDLPERQQEEQLQEELNGNGLRKRGGRKGGNGRKRKAKSEPSSGGGESRMKIRRKSGASGTGGAVSYEDLQNQVGFLKF
jgi:hypothetical protein